MDRPVDTKEWLDAWRVYAAPEKKTLRKPHTLVHLMSMEFAVEDPVVPNGFSMRRLPPSTFEFSAALALESPVQGRGSVGLNIEPSGERVARATEILLDLPEGTVTSDPIAYYDALDREGTLG